MYAKSDNYLICSSKLDDLIADITDENNVQDFSSSKRTLKQYFQHMEDMIAVNILQVHDFQGRDILIRRYQISVTDALLTSWGKLNNCKQQRDGIRVKNNYEIAVFYHCMHCGIKFLENLQLFYPQNFQSEKILPSFLLHFRSKAFLNNVQELLWVFDENRIERKLISLLKDYFYGFLHEKAGNYITWHHWNYALKLSNELSSRLLFLGYADRKEEELIIQLISFNFNHLPFYHFIIEKMHRLVEVNDDPHGQEEQWTHYRVRLRAIPIIKELAADSQLPTIQYSLLTYIDKKLASFRKTRKIWSKFPVGGAKEDSKKYYFRVSLTARQLIFFFRILLELQILMVGKKKMLFTFIANFIGTPNADRLALHSLLSKDDIPSQQVIEKVKEILIKMINHINTKYR
ncbi:hypothetical protein RYH73_16360 [Olivibacter sp. CPCC 100613]|uniref:hypothetical protein n=1 Tax=Olivibacter sp. CPCC 100613 TaxID=3079931 RepID=UPI002FF4A3A5